MAAIKISKILTRNKKLLNRASNMFDDVIDMANEATESSIKAMGGRWKSSSKKVQSKLKSALDAENLTDAIKINNVEAPKKLSRIVNATDSAPIKESKILNSKRATKNVNFVEPTTKDLTGSNIARSQVGLKGHDLRDAVWENIEGKGYEMKDGTFIPVKMNALYSMPGEDATISSVKTTVKQKPIVHTKESLEQLNKERNVYNRSELKKKLNNKNNKKQGDPNNIVYKMAAAGVGGGIVLSMSNRKGQQSNSQLYGQGGY